MSAAPVTTPAPMAGVHLTFGHILRSEWIKLRTLRSTWWCAALIVVLNVGFAVLVAAFTNRTGESIPASEQSSDIVNAATLGLLFTQLIAGVLGVLVISGEFGTGMIRSTFAAVPKRSPAILAKAIVLGLGMLVLGVVSIGGGAALSALLISSHGAAARLDGAGFLALVGGAGYLALVALLSFGIGAILRVTAGAIAVSMGLLLVLPIVLSGLGLAIHQVWAENVSSVLPSQAGGRIYAYFPVSTGPLVGSDGLFELSNWDGLVVLVIWVAVALIGAFALIKRRDA